MYARVAKQGKTARYADMMQAGTVLNGSFSSGAEQVRFRGEQARPAHLRYSYGQVQARTGVRDRTGTGQVRGVSVQ